MKLYPEEYLYTDAFDEEIGPDNDLLIDAEGKISFHLLDSYHAPRGEWSLHDQAMFAVRAVHDAFVLEKWGKHLDGDRAYNTLIPVLSALDLWQKNLKGDFPTDEEANDAAYQLVPLILGHLYPQFVRVVPQELAS